MLSSRTCFALAALAGGVGLLLMRIVPVGIDHEYVDRYREWAKEYNGLVSACGKHEPRDPKCLIDHPLGPRP